MNLLKRACLYLVRKKGKTATLLTFLCVMATLMLTCFSIQSATQTANANMKKALLGYFTINAKQLDTGITEDALKKILSIEGLQNIVFIAIAVAAVICFLVLDLFLTLRLRGRIHIFMYCIG